MSHRVFIVDVFAEEKYAGNQLAVITNGAQLTDAVMQKIARETNFSETTFILSDRPRDEGWDVRIFTPAAELPFAGHPTIGTAEVIRRELLGGHADALTLNLKVGPIAVTFETQERESRPIVWMRQNPPRFGKVVEPEAAAAAIGLAAEDLDDRFPAQEVSTGLPSLIVPVRSLDALEQSKLNVDAYHRLLTGIEAKTVLLFCQGARSAANQLAVRVYAEAVGVLEDPATGSANGCLAGYLVEHRVLDQAEIDLRVEQGYEIGRPSLLRLRARPAESGIEVNVGGRVIPVLRGELV